MTCFPASRPHLRKSVCVFCGAKSGTSEIHSKAASALGESIARRGWRLVYGGARVGLMGEVATSALASGGEVLGVIPEALLKEEVVHLDLSELRVVANMHDRKREMANSADAFVALPGGLGTLEELFEVWTWRQLDFHDKPIGLLNVDSFFNPLLRFLDHSVEAGFLSPVHLSLLQVDTKTDQLLDRISQMWNPGLKDVPPLDLI